MESSQKHIHRVALHLLFPGCWFMLVVMQGGKQENLEGKLKSRDEIKQRNQPTYGVTSRNRTECSDHLLPCYPKVLLLPPKNTKKKKTIQLSQMLLH